MVATTGVGLDELRAVRWGARRPHPGRGEWTLPEPVQRELEELTGMLLRERQAFGGRRRFNEATDLLTSIRRRLDQTDRFDPAISPTCAKDHQKLDFLGFDRSPLRPRPLRVDQPDRWRGPIDRVAHPGISLTDRLDRDPDAPRLGARSSSALLMALMFQIDLHLGRPPRWS